jgi:hypothetical protein
MRHSFYWDDFSRRADETVACLHAGTMPPVRRVAIFITDVINDLLILIIKSPRD